MFRGEVFNAHKLWWRKSSVEIILMKQMKTQQVLQNLFTGKGTGEPVVQGTSGIDELKLKDFDIESVAGGVDKALKENFNVTVKDKTVEVRFQYAGKGNTSIPSRGSYGPLVSAISVEASDLKPPSAEETSSNQKEILIVAGAVMSSLALILMILFVSWRKTRSRKLMAQELRGLDLQTGIFTFRQIKLPSNFNAANKLGEGYTIRWYYNCCQAAFIKSQDKGNREFVNEIGMMSGLRHPNLVRLYGCCVEQNQYLLVYEYMENNSLSHALFGLRNVDQIGLAN
ncbi:hypothetical protein HAX54_050116 [Datura stramonium]|uniref:non-specific serine/threonine protein kinase n=1 Tax=Datura stramonium TaxID=4076 RepID=A0ABS8WPV7_DATST|nr:hypothetical protein [Datura stramonium]